MKLLYLALAVLLATTTDGSATVFDIAVSKGSTLFRAIKTVVFVLGGFGLVGLAVGAIFGTVKWKWFANLAFGLAVLAVAGAIVEYFTEAGTEGNFGDTLK